MDGCRDNSCISCICEYFTTIVRVTGVICAVVLWIISIDGIANVGPYVYILFVAVVLTILEGLFLFESCITKCCDNDGCCGKTWTVVLFLDNWKRSILYVGLAIPCFVFKIKDWPVIFSGVLLILLGILYLIRTFFFVRRTQQTTTSNASAAAGDGRYGEFSNKPQSTPQMAEKGQVPKSEAEMRYPQGDDEMGKKGDVGYGSSSLEERYPHWKKWAAHIQLTTFIHFEEF